jgi:hypothetical protein
MQERFLGGSAGIHPERKGRTLVPRWILFGLLRLFVWVLVASGISVGLALLIGHFRGSDPSRSIPVGLYVGGAALTALSIGGAGGRSTYASGDAQGLPSDLNLRRVHALRGAYVLVGLAVIGVGILFDWLL